jgi:hypothetical protein
MRNYCRFTCKFLAPKKKKREMCVTAVFVASSGHGGIWRGSDIYNNLIGLLSFHKIRTRPSRNQLSQLTPREREIERGRHEEAF